LISLKVEQHRLRNDAGTPALMDPVPIMLNELPKYLSPAGGFLSFRMLCCAVLMSCSLTAEGLAQTGTEQPAVGVAQTQNGPQTDGALKRLQTNPDDAGALIFLSGAKRAAADYAEARKLARRAFRVARTSNNKFGAAMELARISNDQERLLAAQLWLRRAAQTAPSAQLKAQTVQSFRQVRAKSPWRYSFRFSVVPSSNVNNGSALDTIQIGGLPFTLNADAQALSGVLAIVGGGAQYSFDGWNGKPAQLSFSGVFRKAILSEDAKDRAPDAKGSDYDYGAVELQYGQVLSAPDAPVGLHGNIKLGRNWYGGDPLSNYTRVGLSAVWAEPKVRRTVLSFSLEDQKRLDDDLRSARIARLNLSHGWTLGNGNVMTVSGGLRRTNSSSIEIDHIAGQIGLGYALAEDLPGGISVKFDLNLERRVYDNSPYTADGRRDTKVRGAVTFGFDDLAYYGFAPQLTIATTKTNSNVSLYEREDTAVYLSLRSVF